MKLGKRSGHLKAYGKRGKYREAPLNVTVREASAEWMKEMPGRASSSWLWRSLKGKRGSDGEREVRPIAVRAPGYLVKRHAKLAKVENLSCHDLRHRFGYRMGANKTRLMVKFAILYYYHANLGIFEHRKPRTRRGRR